MVRSTGVRSTGVRSRGVRSTGVRSTGVRSTGVRSTGVLRSDTIRLCSHVAQNLQLLCVRVPVEPCAMSCLNILRICI